MNISVMDILTVKSNAIILHGVNCRGKMGKGLALDIRNKYPGVYYDYISDCRVFQDALAGEHKSYLVDPSNNLWVVNLFTQINYARKVGDVCASIALIDQSLRSFKEWYLKDSHQEQIFLPKIGCTLGGLNWDDVEPVIDSAIGDLSPIVCIKDDKW